MLKDPLGGAQVNLVPSEKPSDIYQLVADIASETAAKDAQEGNEVAARWVGKISRKVAKGPTMTTAYGATLYGMREQIQTLLKQAEAKGEPIVDCDKWEAAIYASAVIHRSIGEAMGAAKSAMNWLKGAAHIVAKDGLPVRWTTPLGFPVLQEYRVPIVKEIWSNMSGTKFRMQIQEAGDKLDTRKQGAGIAPNFVHSLDASHMMETINLCLDQGIDSFAMIHDSYGTHACHAEELGVLLREAFVGMYANDVLGDFRQQLIDQVDEALAAKIEELPPKGELDITAVLASEYFFA